MNCLPKRFRCSKCFNLFPNDRIITKIFCRGCGYSESFIDNHNDDHDDNSIEKNKGDCAHILFDEDKENENYFLLTLLLSLQDHLVEDRMSDALFLLGRLIGNLENGEYLNG